MKSNKNKRNKAKKLKVVTEINFSELQDELRQNNRRHNKSKPNRKRRADKK